MPGLLRPRGKLVVPRQLPSAGHLFIDWSHPLTKNLVAAYAPGIMGGYNITGFGLNLARSASTSVAAGPEGIGFKGLATTAAFWSVVAPASLKGLSQMSSFTRVWPNAASNGNSAPLFSLIDTTNNSLVGGSWTNTTTTFSCEFETANSSLDVSPTFTFTNNVPCSLGATYLVGGSGISYINGINSGTISQAAVPTATNAYAINLGGDTISGSYNTGIIYVGYLWTRALTPGEMVQLHVDPYCFLLSDEPEMQALSSGAPVQILSPGNPCEPLILQQPLIRDQYFGARDHQFDTPTFFSFWTQPLDLEKHSPPMDTNQRIERDHQFDTPTPLSFWSEAPDLLRHATHLDTNQRDLWDHQFDTPSAHGWWTEAPDLQRHPTILPTDQRTPLFDHRFDTPTGYFFLQPLDLQRHAPELWANQPYLPPLPSFPGLTPVTFGFWVQPLDLQRHATHMDTNLGVIPFQVIQIGAVTPSAYWWFCPPDLQRLPTVLSTEQRAPLFDHQFDTPISLGFWIDAPDLLRHPTFLPTEQHTPLFDHRFDTPVSFGFWAQALDLLRHPTVMPTDQRAPLFDHQFDTPTLFGFWVEAPDLLRHPSRIDTNQPFVFFPPLPGQTPLIMGFWTQPPDLQRKPPELWVNEPYLPPLPSFPGLTPTSFGFYRQPTDTPRRTPDLAASAGPYVAPGWQFTQAGVIIPVATGLQARPQPIGLLQPFVPSIIVPGALTPSALAFFSQPHLHRHPPELFTWQTYVGAEPKLATPTSFGWYRQMLDTQLLRPDIWTWQPFVERTLPAVFRGARYVAGRPPLLVAGSGLRFIIARRMLTTAALKMAVRTTATMSRSFVARGAVAVSRAPDFSPITPQEQCYATFDFGQALAQGATLTSIVGVTVTVVAGTDAAPSSRLLNVPALCVAPSTLLPNQGCNVLFGTAIAGVTYLLQAVVNTSDGQKFSIEVHWPCVAPV